MMNKTGREQLSDEENLRFWFPTAVSIPISVHVSVSSPIIFSSDVVKHLRTVFLCCIFFSVIYFRISCSLSHSYCHIAPSFLKKNLTTQLFFFLLFKSIVFLLPLLLLFLCNCYIPLHFPSCIGVIMFPVPHLQYCFFIITADSFNISLNLFYRIFLETLSFPVSYHPFLPFLSCLFFPPVPLMWCVFFRSVLRIRFFFLLHVMEPRIEQYDTSKTT